MKFALPEIRHNLAGFEEIVHLYRELAKCPRPPVLASGNAVHVPAQWSLLTPEGKRLWGGSDPRKRTGMDGGAWHG